MSLESINGQSMKLEIDSIIKAHDVGSRSGRIETLEEISALGKEVLENLNEQDANLVEIEGEYEDLTEEIEKLQSEIDTATAQAEQYTADIDAVDARIAELEAKVANGEELTEDEQSELEGLYATRAASQSDVDDVNGTLDDLGGKMSEKGSKLDSYNSLITELTETMDDYTDAGTAVKDSAGQIGRPIVAENAENVMKRNESSWFSLAFRKNDTEVAVARAGLTGMHDGDNVGFHACAHDNSVTYHNDVSGGYTAEYDIMQYSIGGGLRDATVKTYSYGKTVETASQDMKSRAEDLKDGVKKTKDETDS